MAEEQTMTPMMVQYWGIKEKYKNEVVFFRLGDFYEMFDNDAVEVSRLLNLTLTHRASQPMCGIPYHAAKIYIARLLRLGKKIVISTFCTVLCALTTQRHSTFSLIRKYLSILASLF